MGRGSRSENTATVAIAGADMRELLLGRRPVEDRRRVPSWSSPPTFANYGEFLNSRGTDAMRQSDHGFGWRHARGERGRRLSWLPDTGDLILFGPREDGMAEHDTPVEVLAEGILSEAELKKVITGNWANAHNRYKDPLAWLRRTLAKNGYGAVPAAFDPAA